VANRNNRTIEQLSNRKINRFAFIILLIFNAHLSAQPTSDPIQLKIDSLKGLLPGSDIKQQVDLLNALASIYAPLNFDTAIGYAVQAQRIATVSGFPIGVGTARLYTGNAYYYKMDLKNALLSYLAAQKVLEEFKPVKELGDLYMQLGNINYFLGRTENTVSLYRIARQNYMAVSDLRSAVQIPYAIMFTYLMNNQFDSALFYGNEYLAECDRLNDPRLKAFGLNIVGWIYSAMKDDRVKQKAIDCIFESLDIATELNDATLTAINYLSLGNNYDRSDFYYEGAKLDLPLARTFYKKAFLAAHTARIYLLMGAINNYLAAIDIEERKFREAEANLQLSKSYLDTLFLMPYMQYPVSPFQSFGKMVDYILGQQHRILLYDLSSRLAMAKGESRKAIDYLRLFYQYSDSLFARRQARQFELLIAEADAEKTDQKMRTLEQENELNQLRLNRSRLISAGIGAFVVIISLSILLFFQRKRLKAEQKSISMEQRLLRAQMNPHFLFNSLASIQNYIINEDTDHASIYLSRFSQLVRNILDNSLEEYVPLEKEVETVRYYLDLQKVRYAGKFDFNIEIDENIDEENTMIPPMLAQPFIENAIEHGIRHKTGFGHIEIRFLMEDGFIRFEVEDDGVGREKAREIEALQGRKHRSMATSITIDRLASINRKQKKKIRLEIADLMDADGKACGTRVRFGIPVGGRRSAVGGRQSDLMI
jgi:hypothetical protein